MVEGARLERVYTGNRIKGSNPFLSATFPIESLLPTQLRLDFSIVFEGYTAGAKHWPVRSIEQKRSRRTDILLTS